MAKQDSSGQHRGSEKEPETSGSDAAVNVIAFPRAGDVRRLRPTHAAPGQALPALSLDSESPLPVETLARYERSAGDDDDYRHRMATNVVAFAVCVGLIVTGVWITNTIVNLRHDQDCVLAGRPNCAHISVAGQLR